MTAHMVPMGSAILSPPRCFCWVLVSWHHHGTRHGERCRGCPHRVAPSSPSTVSPVEEAAPGWGSRGKAPQGRQHCMEEAETDRLTAPGDGQMAGWRSRCVRGMDGWMDGEIDGCVGEEDARIDRQRHRWRTDACSPFALDTPGVLNCITALGLSSEPCPMVGHWPGPWDNQHPSLSILWPHSPWHHHNHLIPPALWPPTLLRGTSKAVSKCPSWCFHGCW